jgi:small subunit ribosomal protein S6
LPTSLERDYEAAIVFRPDLSEERLDAHLRRLADVVRQQGGQPGEPDKWGRRRLAYEIQHLRDGYYVILPFRSPPSAPRELERVLRITDDVIRFLVVHPPKPSAPRAPEAGRGHAAEAATPDETGEVAHEPTAVGAGPGEETSTTR